MLYVSLYFNSDFKKSVCIKNLKYAYHICIKVIYKSECKNGLYIIVSDSLQY